MTAPDDDRIDHDPPEAEAPADDAGGGPEPWATSEHGDGQLSYDCAAWAGETRGLLASLLGSSGIEHVWQGTTLTVHERDEDAVDELVEEVLASAGSALEPGVARVVYEVGTWPAALQSQLAEALTLEDVAYEWDHNGDLVVAADDEERVSLAMDALPDPDDEAVSSDDGVALHELLDRIFLAADRLTRNADDAAGIVDLVEGADLLGRLALPFGFEPAQWRALVERVDELSAAVAPPTPGDPDADRPDPVDPEVVAASAARLREELRAFV